MHGDHMADKCFSQGSSWDILLAHKLSSGANDICISHGNWIFLTTVLYKAVVHFQANS